MAAISISQRAANRLKKLIDTWGRWSDRGSSYDISLNLPPQENPQEELVDSDELFDFSMNPYAKAGIWARDIGNLFVSASGMEPDENGASFPAQLIYTQEGGDPEILESLPVQYDEAFEPGKEEFMLGGFGSTLRKLQNARKNRGYCIAENSFVRGDIREFKDFIWVNKIFSRDPEPYTFDYLGKPGLYFQPNSYSTPQKLDANKFMSYAYDPLFDNPYGTSINLPLMQMLQDFNKNWGYWRHALEKAGMGSWIAHYPDKFSGVDSFAVNWRAELNAQLKKIASGCFGIIHEAVNLESMKLDADLKSFAEWNLNFIQAVSVLYTGSATALIEGKFGSRAMAEATIVREKSKREQLDAMEASAFWTYQFNRIWCDLNFPQERINGIYPTLQLIKPELIMPTTPRDQEQINVSTGQAETSPESSRNDAKDAEQQELSAPNWIQIDKEAANIIQQKIIDDYEAGRQWKVADLPIETTSGSPIEDHDKPLIFHSPEENAELIQKLENGTEIYYKNGDMWRLEKIKSSQITELQEEEEEPETDKPPVSVPASYEEFPRKTPLPPSYRDTTEFAKAYLLEEIEAKPYEDLESGEGADIFTIKQLRNFKSLNRETETELLTKLKNAINTTLELANEADAWNKYYIDAVLILNEYGIKMDPAIRSDLTTSFRQTRQNAYSGGLISFGKADGAVGVRIRNLEDGHEIRPVHRFWNNIVVPIDHEELQAGGRLRPPMGFNCVCFGELVYNLVELTPESNWPAEYPGESYKYYKTT
jgi:hypothetical protein